MENKFTKGIVIAFLVVAVAGLGLLWKISNQEDVMMGTSFTQNTSNDSYTDGADMRQNVQAAVERLSGVDQYQILQANSAGSMEAVDPKSLAGTGWTMSEARLTSSVDAGVVATFTATTTASAANVCDSRLWTVTAGSTSASVPITLPATSTLFADCLTTNGDTVSFNVLNDSGTTSTVFAAGTGGTLTYSSTTTIAAGKTATFDLFRSSAIAYKVLMTNQAN